MQELDVIIVGAGPAGASCAKALNVEGLDVLVLEKHALPRYKTCSGILLGQTQELLLRHFGKSAPDEVHCQGERHINADDILEWSPGHGYVPYVWELDKDGHSFPRIYQNIWRDKFDKWLLDESGAAWLDGQRVTDFEVKGEQVHVRAQTANGDETTEYRCRYLVGADGNASVVRRTLSASAPQAGEASPKLAVLQSYFKIGSRGTLKAGEWLVFFVPGIGDILSCVHQKDDYLVLHVGGLRGLNLRDAMEKFKKFLFDNFDLRVGDWWRDEGCQIDLAPPFLGEGRTLLTGEAGGFMYLNGEGISAAIDSGYRCGKAIAQALRQGTAALPLYTDTTRDLIAHVRKCVDNARFFVPR